MQKWEYCVIEGVGINYYWCCRLFTSEGFKEVASYKNTPKGQMYWTSFAKAIAQLGDEGWEMVGCGNADATYHSIYFKRPKE